MKLRLKSCERCQGDVLEEKMPGYPVDQVCLQCGKRNSGVERTDDGNVPAVAMRS